MSQTQSRLYRIDPFVEDYRSFFDHEWAKVFLAAADRAGMAEEAMNLCEAWKGAANTARLPWLSVEMMEAFAVGYHRSRRPYTLVFLEALTKQLAAGIQPPLSTDHLAGITAAARDLDAGLVADMQALPVPFDRQEVWGQLLQEPEFGISILASQRLAYAAVYYAYEDFLLVCFKGVTGLPDYRIDRDFPKRLALAFGDRVADSVWNHLAVAVARKVRHAIVHNGCRITNDLQRLAHGLEVIDGRLQITASVARTLFDSLKVRANTLLAEKAKLGQRSAPGGTP